MKPEIDFSGWEKAIDSRKDIRPEGGILASEWANRNNIPRPTARHQLDQLVRVGMATIKHGKIGGQSANYYVLTKGKKPAS